VYRVYVQQLELYHQMAVKFDPANAKQHPRRLQLYFLQALHQPWYRTLKAFRYARDRWQGDESVAELELERELRFSEAIALLGDTEYVPAQRTGWEWFKILERAARSPMSIFAFKSAAGFIVFAILLFADSTRQFFLDYQLTAGLCPSMWQDTNF
jgi:hypothetical protein